MLLIVFGTLGCLTPAPPTMVTYKCVQVLYQTTLFGDRAPAGYAIQTIHVPATDDREAVWQSMQWADCTPVEFARDLLLFLDVPRMRQLEGETSG